MKLMVFSVFDSKAGNFAPPFFMHREGEAVRAFTELVNDKNTMPGKYPNDFSLFHLGEFDDYSAEYVGCKPRNISIGSSLVKVKEDSLPLFENVTDKEVKELKEKLIEKGKNIVIKP